MKGLLGSSSKSDGVPPTPETTEQSSPGGPEEASVDTGPEEASVDTPYSAGDQDDAGAGYIQPAFSPSGDRGDSSVSAEREGSIDEEREGEAIKVNLGLDLFGNYFFFLTCQIEET